eukprot:g12626.t1
MPVGSGMATSSTVTSVKPHLVAEQQGQAMAAQELPARCDFNRSTATTPPYCTWDFSFLSPAEWDFSQGGIYFLRHAESLANVVDYAGGTNTLEDPALSEAGEREARTVGRFMQAELLRVAAESPGRKVRVHLVVSPLRRTLQTAELVFFGSSGVESDLPRREAGTASDVAFTMETEADFRETHPRASNVGIPPVPPAPASAHGQDQCTNHDDTSFSLYAQKYFDAETMQRWRAVARSEEHMLDATRLARADKMLRQKYAQMTAEGDREADASATASARPINLLFAVTHWGFVNCFGNVFCRDWALVGAHHPLLANAVARKSISVVHEEILAEEEKETLFERKTSPSMYSLLRDDRYGHHMYSDFPLPESVADPSDRVYVRNFDVRNCSLTKIEPRG